MFHFVSKMTPVERFAIRFLESSGAYITLEQIKAAKVGKSIAVTLMSIVQLNFQCLTRFVSLLGHDLSDIKTCPSYKLWKSGLFF